mmetsp:Transcript_9511/g.27202  ORF Transcript_9511/g.27202 Transcript_9511/m.27202 type:complete len:173 (-) Transcript_9511:628-1146(-)
MYGYNPVSDTEGGFGKADYAAQFAESQVRSGFIRKVFGILSIQLLLTVALSSVFIVSNGAKLFVANNIWTVYVAMGLTLAIALGMSCCESARNSFPTNYILLFAFTLAEGFLVLTLCHPSPPPVDAAPYQQPFPLQVPTFPIRLMPCPWHGSLAGMPCRSASSRPRMTPASS